MPTEGLAALRVYMKNLKRRHNPFPCSECGNLILAKDYEKHYSTLHQLDSKLNCVWCRGNVSWERGQKSFRVDHLLECFRNFMALIAFESQHNITEFNLEPMCQAKSFFGHARVPTLPPRAFELVWPLPLDPDIPRFDDDSLNLATSCVRKYLELNDTTEWFHVMVRAVAFESFLQALDEDEGRTRTLPFSCWCDGGTHKEDHIRQHRHMIVVSSPKGHFLNNVWKKISIPPEDRPYKNIRCMQRKFIHSPLHLVNCLGYLSQRKSRCNFSFNTDRQTKENLNHFQTLNTIPADYKLPLVLQWDGGIMQLVRQEFLNLSIAQLHRAPLFFAGRCWHLKVKDLPGIKLDMALPISKHLKFVKEPTNHFFHLTGGRKLYFCHQENQARSTMLPLFYNEVGEETWTPGVSHQRILNTVKPIVEQNTELVAENIALKRKHEDEVEELRNKVDKQNTTIRRLKEEMRSSRRLHNTTIRRLNEEMRSSRRLYKGEIARLNEEMRASRRLHEGEIVRLHEEMRASRRLHEGEIARLNEEVCSLKTLSKQMNH